MFKLTGIEIGLVCEQEMNGMTQITFKQVQTDKKSTWELTVAKTKKTGIKNYLAWMQTTMMQTISRRNFQWDDEIAEKNTLN